MSTKLILGLILLVVGGGLIPGTMYLGSYIDDKIDETIEEARTFDVDKMNWTEGDDADDRDYFYEDINENKYYSLWNVTNQTATNLGEDSGYNLVGPIRLNVTTHKLILEYNETAKTVTYLEFMNSTTYYNSTYEAMAGINVTMYNKNYYLLHAIGAEPMVTASAFGGFLTTYSIGDNTTWNLVVQGLGVTMGINATEFGTMVSGTVNITDLTTAGILYGLGVVVNTDPGSIGGYLALYAANLSGLGLDSGNLTALGGLAYALMNMALVNDGLSEIATHTVDEWLFGWDSDILTGAFNASDPTTFAQAQAFGLEKIKAPGFTTRAGITDDHAQMIYDMGMMGLVGAMGVDIKTRTIKTGEDDVMNTGDMVSENGVTNNYGDTLAADPDFYWTTFADDVLEDYGASHVKYDVEWWPGVTEDDVLYVWDSAVGWAWLNYTEDTEVKGIDTLGFLTKDITGRNMTEVVLAGASALGGGAEIQNPFYYYGTGFVDCDVEPTTGLAIKAQKYFEFTIVDPANINNATYKEHIFDERGGIEGEDEDDLKEALDDIESAEDLADNIPLYGMIGGIGIIGLGAVLLALGKK